MIGIIGAGNMATAIVSGLHKNNFPMQDVIISDISENALTAIHENFKVQITQDNRALCQQSNCILFAVKPQQFPEICLDIKSVLTTQWVISILAGLSTTQLCKQLEANIPVVRTMPNLGAQVQAGITALFANEKVSATQKQYAEKLFLAVGECIWLENESDLHAVTALSGSGPSYFFHLMASMIQQGVALGLTESVARKLVIHTCLGSTKLVCHSESIALEALIQQVCSKGGTTEAAMSVFTKNSSSDIIQKAVLAAYHRSITLSGET